MCRLGQQIMLDCVEQNVVKYTIVIHRVAHKKWNAKYKHRCRTSTALWLKSVVSKCCSFLTDIKIFSFAHKFHQKADFQRQIFYWWKKIWTRREFCDRLNCVRLSRRQQLVVVGFGPPHRPSDLVTPRCRLSTYGSRAFSVAGPVYWNALTDYLKSQRTFLSIVLGNCWKHFYFADIDIIDSTTLAH